MRKLSIGLIAALSITICQGGLITSDPGTGTTTTFTGTNSTDGAGPFVVNGFSVSGTNVAFGDAPYGLGTNGAWVSFSWVAANSSSSAITFDLGASYGLVGGFMNYSTPHDPLGTNPTITALAADGTTVLESDILSVLAPISTPAGTNAGAFRGISRAQGDIRFLSISGDFILTHTLEVGAAAAVPEPGAVGLTLGGLGLIFLRRLHLAFRRS
jgi:hypothetical protein